MYIIKLDLQKFVEHNDKYVSASVYDENYINSKMTGTPQVTMFSYARTSYIVCS